MEVNSASIWNTSPNISTRIGNKYFRFIYDETPYEIDIPDGTYGISELQGYLSFFFVNNGLDSGLIQLTGSTATQQVVMTFLDFANTRVLFGPDTCYDVLGFNQGTLVPTTESVFGDSVAMFNRINSYFIKSNLLSGGISQNNISSGILAAVPILSKIGSLTNYYPQNPVRSNADELIGQSKQSLTFTLVDQLERDVGTSGEEWTFGIVIRYTMPASSQKQGIFDATDQ